MSFFLAFIVLSLIADIVAIGTYLQYCGKCHNATKYATKIMIEISPINARTLILDLVLTNEPPVYTIQQLLKAGEALGIGESAIRSALSRLTREGQVENVQRGLYGIGPKGRPLQDRLLSWREHVHPPRAWSGGWYLAIAGAADRADRTVWRRTLRALRLQGFAEAEPGIWARPDNTDTSLDDFRRILLAIGGAPSLLLLRATEMDEHRLKGWRRLWSVPEMQARYREMQKLMLDSTRDLGRKSVADAAAETLLIGRTGVRILHFDPALPEELCPSEFRRKMTETMITYNRRGTKLWFDLLGIS